VDSAKNLAHAWRLEGPRQARLRELELPDLTDDTVHLRSVICAVSGIDLTRYSATQPLPGPAWVGQECGGIVARAGAGTDLALGQAVAAWIPPGWRWGGLADRTVVPARFVVPIEHRERAWVVAPLMRTICTLTQTHPLAGPLAHNCPHPLVRFGYRPHAARHIVVFGTGSVGLLAAAVALLEDPASLTVVGRSESSLVRASAMGAHHVINNSGRPPDSVIEEIRGLTPDGHGVDLAIETVGRQSTLDLAFAATRIGGTVSLAGFHHRSEEFDFGGGGPIRMRPGRRFIEAGRDMGVGGKHLVSGHAREVRATGLAQSEDIMFAALQLAGRWVNEGTIDASPLVARTWSLNDGARALDAATRGSGKHVVDSAT
jgi:threonine dehydrogenase-like Zn-dependent dehydrogenase